MRKLFFSDQVTALNRFRVEKVNMYMKRNYLVIGKRLI